MGKQTECANRSGYFFYRETHEKVNITWNANRTVTYRQNKWWYFDQENSNGTLDDVITTLNVVTLVCLSLVSTAPWQIESRH